MSAAAQDEHELDDFDDDFEDAPPPPNSRWRRLKSIGSVKSLAAVPALIAATAAIAVAIAPRGNIEGDYRTQVVEALSSQQYHRAIVGAERLLQRSPFTPEYRFWLGLAHDAIGDKDVAEGIMNGLAPRDRAGYGPAHFWQADKLLKIEPLTPLAVREAEIHLRRVDPEQMKTEAVMRRMALVMLKTNRLEDARVYLGGADMSANPDLRVNYAEALFQRGLKDDGDRELRKAIDELRDKVNKLGKSSNDSGFARRSLADALVLNGDFVEAERVLQQGVAVGPADRYVRPLAQFYAKWLAAAENGSIAPPKAKGVDEAIELLAKSNDESLLSNGLLSFLYQRTGRLDKAAARLESLADKHPDAAFDLIRIYSRMNRPDDAAKAAQGAVRLLTTLVEKNPDDSGLRERLAEALLLVNEFERATIVLEDGIKRGDRQNFKPQLARAYVAWWDAIAAGKSKANGDRFDLLKRAIDADPWNPLVFSRLGAVDGKDAKLAREMVTSLLVKGESPPAAIHWILGNEAWARGEKSLARVHMEQAYSLAPSNPLVLNNFAWMLAFSDPVDLPRAVKLAEEAVRIAPKAVDLRDTRGRIYAKSKEWAKAVSDLQLCLPMKRNDVEFLMLLAETCDRSGLADLAAQYRNQAEEVRKGRAAPKSNQ